MSCVETFSKKRPPGRFSTYNNHQGFTEITHVHGNRMLRRNASFFQKCSKKHPPRRFSTYSNHQGFTKIEHFHEQRLFSENVVHVLKRVPKKPSTRKVHTYNNHERFMKIICFSMRRGYFQENLCRVSNSFRKKCPRGRFSTYKNH